MWALIFLAKPARRTLCFDGLVDDAGIDVVAARDARTWIHRQLAGRKQVLPSPLLARVRIFPQECVRQVDLPVAPAQVLLVESFNLGEMILKERHKAYCKSGDSVLVAFARSHNDLLHSEVA